MVDYEVERQMEMHGELERRELRGKQEMKKKEGNYLQAALAKISDQSTLGNMKEGKLNRGAPSNDISTSHGEVKGQKNKKERTGWNENVDNDNEDDGEHSNDSNENTMCKNDDPNFFGQFIVR